ncbi:hypothetical protein BOX15_Mlig002223g2, partial [Macrostomum lignano]
LFLIALGGIKWFESRSEEWEDGEFEKDYLFAKAKKKIQRRSIEAQTERWMMEHYAEQLLEVQHGTGLRATIDCGAVADDACSCNFLQCFGQQLCQRNVTGAVRHTFVRCRSAVIYDQVLCECKRHTRLPPTGTRSLLAGDGGEGSDGAAGDAKDQLRRRLRHRRDLLLREQQSQQQQREPPMPAMPAA